jgi:hypothetical protein
MKLRIWYFVTLLLVGLLMGTSFGHTLEMPAKLRVDEQLWMTFQHTLYPYFAYAGAPIELGAIVTAAVLSFLVRRQDAAYYFALLGAACVTLAFFVVWLGFTNPVNAETAGWTASSIPSDWAQWRRQWEYSHAVRFGLHLIGFSALVLSSLIMGPSRTR